MVLLATTLVLALAAAPDPRPWMNKADPPGARAKKIVAQMTQEEKVAMLHGPLPPMACCECSVTAENGSKVVKDPACAYTGNVVPNERLGIPPIHMNDGPQGFRENIFPGTTTAWPSSLTIAASWDTEMAGKWGDGMGREFFAKGANVQLGPGVCLARVPRNGRNFEYLSGEDPYLGNILVQPVIKGIQSNNVVANAKHYVQNNQETNRGAVDEIVDERTRFEMYYPPFAGAAKAGLGSIMCSYNKIDAGGQPGGVWSCENPTTLGDLKDKLGFTGWVMSDWGATHSTSLMQGLDQEMPGAAFMGPGVTAGLAAKNITTAALDESVTRILTGMFQAGVMDTFAKDKMAYHWSKHSHNVTSDAAAALARTLSAASTVLLKNEMGVLPLKKAAKIAVIGLAGQGNALTHGGGSGQVTPSWTITPLAGFAAAGAASVTYADGTDVAKATAAAKAADVVVVFAGSLSHEGGDRKDLTLNGGDPKVVGIADQDALIEAVAAANPKTVVVLTVPGAILMPWSPKVAAVLTNFMPGQQAGHAICDVLFGTVNPSAKLPITMPNKENEVDFSPAQWPGLPDPKNPTYANYTERLLVGYRYYDAKGLAFTTGFPFGHGLSYTSFAYSGLKVSAGEVSLTITNNGTLAGAEVAQLYLGYPAEAGEPPKVLRGFQKVHLAAGAAATVSFALNDGSTSIWDVTSHGWKKVAGSFDVMVGSSSRDIRATGKLAGTA